MKVLLALAALLLLAPGLAAQSEGPDDLAFVEELRADFARGGSWSAQRELAGYLEEFPASPGARRLAAEVALDRGRLDEAEAHLAAGGLADAALWGRLLLRAGRCAEALDL
ncbi:MAG: hypothetical protein FJ296_09410, partial [Planctomycetes bacterium]|nr:hypothetical protein [Planctomycetota bacterium]